MEKQIWLIRHPEIENADSRYFYGSSDVGLSPRGVEQAGRLAEFLQKNNLKRIITSGLKRSDYLGRMVARTEDISWEVEPFIKEMHFGRWEGMPAAEVERTEPERYKDCLYADMNFRFPGGESVREFFDRVKKGLEKIVKESDESLIAIITHSGVVRMVLMDILNFDYQAYWRFRIDYGSLTALDIYDDFIHIRKINDTCHLNGLCPN